MAIRISDLPAAAGASTAMQFEVNNGGTSQRLTLAQMFALSTAVAADAPLLNLAQTWNNAAVAFTALKLNITDTASDAASLLLDFQRGGSSLLKLTKSGSLTLAAGVFFIGSGSQLIALSQYGIDIVGNSITRTNSIAFSDSGAGSTAEFSLLREAANTLAQRNGTSAQTFNLYKSYTDASNYERLACKTSSTYFLITSEAAGTGTQRALKIGTAGSATLYLRVASVDRWLVDGATGNFLTAFDNTNDIGASGGNRPRNIYAAGSIYGGGFGGPFGATFNEVLSGAGWAISGRLMFGGTSNAFPALKRNAAALEVKLADDSAYAELACATVDFKGGAATAPTSSAAGFTPTSYLGDDYNVMLSPPTTWLLVKVAGTNYRVPLYPDA